MPTTLTIVGAGKLGTTLARMFLRAGHRTILTSRSDAAVLDLVVGAVAPGAEAMALPEAVAASGAAVLALPMHRVPELPHVLGSVLTIDATNYWEPTDGALPSFVDRSRSSSESVAAALGLRRVVKAFNHLGYHDLDLAAGRGGDERLALGVAGDDADDRAEVAHLVEEVGLAPVVLDGLRAGRALEPGHPAFGTPLTQEGLRDLLGAPVLGSVHRA